MASVAASPRGVIAAEKGSKHALVRLEEGRSKVLRASLFFQLVLGETKCGETASFSEIKRSELTFRRGSATFLGFPSLAFFFTLAASQT